MPPDFATIKARYPRDWAATQHQKYLHRRRFMRGFLLQQIATRVVAKPNMYGADNIPPTGSAILMMNHTITVDGLIVLGMVRPRFVVPMIKIENFQHPLFRIFVENWGAYPVIRDTLDRHALRLTLDLLAHEQLVLIAPEGTRQKALQQPKDGLAYIAQQSNALIIPTAIFHVEGWLRAFVNPFKRIYPTLCFGRPFRLRSDQTLNRKDLSAATTEMMYQLAQLLPAAYRGAFADIESATTQYLTFEAGYLPTKR